MITPRRMVRWTLAGLIAAVLAVVTIGYALPQSHVATGEAQVNAAPSEVFATLVDVERYPTWRKEVTAVEVISKEPLRWREHASSDVITFETMTVQAPDLRVVRIADPDLPFGGTWTYELTPSGSGTRVVITERGEVYNPVFRFVSRFVFGHTATIDQFLASLQARFTGASKD